jgi:hypothetical protein
MVRSDIYRAYTLKEIPKQLRTVGTLIEPVSVNYVPDRDTTVLWCTLYSEYIHKPKHDYVRYTGDTEKPISINKSDNIFRIYVAGYIKGTEDFVIDMSSARKVNLEISTLIILEPFKWDKEYFCYSGMITNYESYKNYCENNNIKQIIVR